MSLVKEQIRRASSKWSFKGMVIGLPIAAACFMAEVVLALARAQNGDVVGVAVDAVPALGVLVVGTVFFAILESRANCEGRTVDRMAWVYLLAAVVFGAWGGGCVAELAVLQRTAHTPMVVEDLFGRASCLMGALVNLLAVVALSREVLKRCPVVPEAGC